MKLSLRLWILGISLTVSIVSIIAGSASLKLFVFLSCLLFLISLTFTKSRTIKIIVTITFLVILIFSFKSSIEGGGVVINSVDLNSTELSANLKQGEIIREINGKQVKNKDSYNKIIDEIFSESNNEEKSLEIKTDKNNYFLLVNKTLPFVVEDVPKTNIRTGLDLRGGARAIIQPEVKLNEQQIQDLVEVSRNRFNVYGLSDVNIKGVTDLEGNNFMLIEVAGATPKDLENLISEQGKFEAKIGNKTVFVGEKEDISDVCKNNAKCAAITNCFPNQDSYVCNFQFTVYLTESAAQKHAELTRNLTLDESGQYLSEKLYLFVDGKEVDSLLISSGLRGRVETQIQIQGSGTGTSKEEALKNARENMNRLQTILLTGSLPYKLTIVKLDTISPQLGKDFIFALLMVAIVSITLVSLIIFARYRKIKSSVALLFTSFSELVIILGIASLIPRWNLDLPSIAGILATIGTGVDQQIVILDEAERSKNLSIKERFKRATFIIFSAYLTLLAAMIPLYWAGAGLFKGFALTTIIGFTVGILITRPAFAEIIKNWVKTNE